MDVLLFTEVDVHGLHRTRDIIGDPFHGFADTGPATVLNGQFRLARHETRQLDDNEGILLTPGLVPGLDHGTKDPLVGLRLTGVGFALIPDCSAHRITDERGDHAIPIHVGPVGPDRGEPARILTQFGQGSLVLLDRDLGVELLEGDGAGLDGRRFLGVEILGVSDVGIHALRTPGFGARAADRGMDHADRLLEVGAQFAGEEKSGRGETLDGVRCGEFPGTIYIVGGIGLGRAGDGEDAEAGVGGAGLGVRGGGGVLDDPIHVRLAGTDPDFADDDVMGGEDFLARAHDEILALLGRL